MPTAIGLAAILIAETVFILFAVQASPYTPKHGISNVGLTASIGTGLFTKYLLPFEITSILLLMAIVGAMTLARRGDPLSSTARVVPGAQVLAMDVLNPRSLDHTTAVETHSTEEAAHLLGVELQSHPEERD